MSAVRRWPAGWRTPNVGLWTGVAALGVAVLTVTEFLIHQIALTVGHALFFGSIGSIGCVLTAVVSFASGYITLISGALPRWTGRLAVAVAIPNLVLVGTAFGGTDDTSFRAAGGWGSVALGTFPWLVWIVSVGIVVIRGRAGHLERAEMTRATQTEQSP